MSSHHFVTESQSTAVILLGRNVHRDLLNQLLEWNPLVIVDESVIDLIVEFQIRADVILFSSEKEQPQLPYQFQSRNRALLEKEILMDLQAGKLSSIAFAGIDDTMERKVLEPYGNWGIPVVAYAGARKHNILSPGRKFKKWVPKGYRFHLDHNEVEIIGHVIDKADAFLVQESGILEINPLEEVMLTEYIVS